MPTGRDSLARGQTRPGMLCRGALNRRVTTKASISAATAAMAGVPSCDFNVFPYTWDGNRILDLIPQQRTKAPAVHYFAATTAASAAAAVAEGAAKPESTPVWTVAPEPLTATPTSS